ncbi:MAG: tetratricopeptide repeat protein [Anaerolineae bacterium]|nr:tetratricopeptide repeat protein [Anaerolineae bacterium]
MRCPSCGAENPDNRATCEMCGAALSGDIAVSLDSGVQYELNVARQALEQLRRFVPAVILESLLHNQERLRGERREVAVLFVDAVEFTSLAASLDAEAVFNLINDLLGRLVACVHRFGGMVDKFTGDGLMAVFGAPIAHENDSELAVRAALEMQRAASEFAPIAQARLGAPLQVRIGLHSGVAIAGILGNQEQAAYTVIGETVNLAARLESLARPGHILVSRQVYQQTQTKFEFKVLGEVLVKGVERPIEVYEAVEDRYESKTNLDSIQPSGIFLGHQAEIEFLHHMLVAALDDSYGRLLVVHGEAGIGKSSLVNEWLSGIQPEQVTVLMGRGTPYVQGVSYSTLSTLLRGALKGNLIEESWTNYVSPDLHLFLRDMLGMPLTAQESLSINNLTPDRMKQLTTLAIREWVLGIARKRPVILVFDNFQWVDAASYAVIQALLSLVYETTVLFVVVTRPQPLGALRLEIPPLEHDPDLDLSITLDVGALSVENSRKLLGNLLDLDSMPESFIRTILARAEGNPFYIEEFVRMLVEKKMLKLEDGRWVAVSVPDLETLAIPTTLQGLMMARIDRLPEALRRVLRNAAIIGLQFDVNLLGIIEYRLHGTTNLMPIMKRLISLGLLVARPELGTHIYAFRHMLVQEIIYNSILHSQRPDLHQVVALTIEELYATNLDRYAEVLAFHYDRARVRDKAMSYAISAGNHARQRFSNTEAVEYYSRALQLSQHLGECLQERWRAATGLGQVHQRIGEYEDAIALYRAALEEWVAAPLEAKAEVMLYLGQVWDKLGNLREAETWLRQGVVQLNQAAVSAPELRAQLYSELGWQAIQGGNLTEAQTWLEKAWALLQSTDSHYAMAKVLDRFSVLYLHQGELQNAIKNIEQALAASEKLSDIVSVSHYAKTLGNLQTRAGDWEQSLNYYKRSLDLMQKIGDLEGIIIAHANLGQLYMHLGQWSRAEGNLLHAFDMAQRIAHSHELTCAHINLSRLHLLRGDLELCAEHLNAVFVWYKERGNRVNMGLVEAYFLNAELHLGQAEVEAARESLERGYHILLDLKDTNNGHSMQFGHYERLMGRLALEDHDYTTAHERLAHSRQIFEGVSCLFEVGKTEYWIALTYIAQDLKSDGMKTLNKALAIFQKLGAAAEIQRVEALLSTFQW